jgi:hypothetical protein
LTNSIFKNLPGMSERDQISVLTMLNNPRITYLEPLRAALLSGAVTIRAMTPEELAQYGSAEGIYLADGRVIAYPQSVYAGIDTTSAGTAKFVDTMQHEYLHDATRDKKEEKFRDIKIKIDAGQDPNEVGKEYVNYFVNEEVRARYGAYLVLTQDAASGSPTALESRNQLNKNEYKAFANAERELELGSLSTEQIANYVTNNPTIMNLIGGMTYTNAAIAAVKSVMQSIDSTGKMVDKFSEAAKKIVTEDAYDIEDPVYLSDGSWTVKIKYESGRETTESYAANGKLTRTENLLVNYSGQPTSRTITTPIQGTTLTQTATTSYTNGQPTGTSYTAENAAGQTVVSSDTPLVANANGTLTGTVEGSTVVSNASTGRPILITDSAGNQTVVDAAGNNFSAGNANSGSNNATILIENGVLISASFTNVNGSTTTLNANAGMVTSTTNHQNLANGTSRTITDYPGGRQSITTTATNGSTHQVYTPNPADPLITTTTDRNAAGQVTGSTSTSPVTEPDINSASYGQPIPGQYLVVTNNAAGQTTATSLLQVNPIDGTTSVTPITGPAGTDPGITTTTTPANPATGAPASTTQQPNSTSALANLDLAGVLLGVNSLLNALHGPAAGNGLPIATTFAGLANTITSGQVPVINGLSTGLGLASSVWGLRSAILHGSNGGIILSGANVISQFGGAYATHLGYEQFYGTTTTGLSNSLNGVLGCLTLRTTDLIAAYVQGTRTMGVNGVKNMNPKTQTIDNGNPIFEQAGIAIGVVKEVAVLLNLANVCLRSSYRELAKDVIEEFDGTTYSIAYFSLFKRTIDLNFSESRSANDNYWKRAA